MLNYLCAVPATIETVQDFLIKLDIKPLMHLLEISIFSLNNDLVRLTKIMKNLVKDSEFQSYFSVSQIVRIFTREICEEYLTNLY